MQLKSLLWLLAAAGAKAFTLSPSVPQLLSRTNACFWPRAVPCPEAKDLRAQGLGAQLIKSRSLGLRMAGEAPSNYYEAQVVKNEELGPGSKLLRVKALSFPDDTPYEYQPGNVLALKIPPEDVKELEPEEGVDPSVSKHGDGTLAPYTITRAHDSQNTFDIVYRVIKGGRMSRRLSSMKRGSKIEYSGKFHVPIIEGIAADCSKIVCVSTGVGIGPMLGYLEQALEQEEQRPIALYNGFRSFQDLIFEDELEELVDNSDGLITYSPCVSEFVDERYPPPPGYEGLRGRVTQAVPRVLEPDSLMDTHFHFIGNGGMVNNFKEGLLEAGVPEEHITIERYFNGKLEPEPSEVKEICKTLKAKAVDPRWAGAET